MTYSSTIVSLQDVKAWLRNPNPSAPSADDAAIQRVIDAAQLLVEGKVGITVPRLFDEYYNGGNYKIWLRRTPVLEIVSVTESYGPVSFNLEDQPPTTGAIIDGTGNEPAQTPAVHLWAYSLDVPGIGEVTRRGPLNTPFPFVPGDRNIRVTYWAGRDPITASIQVATMELVAHLWQNSQLRSMAMSNQFVQYDTVSGIASERPDTSQAFWVGVPKRIIGLLEADMGERLPVIA